MKHYVVTFEEKMRVWNESKWIEGSRVFEDIEGARGFLEFMYSTNEGNFRNAHLWCGVEISHNVEAKVVFDEDFH